MTTDKNQRLETGAELFAACTNVVQATESLSFAMNGKGAYPLNKLIGMRLSNRASRILAAILGILYLISAVGETGKFLEDVTGDA